MSGYESDCSFASTGGKQPFAQQAYEGELACLMVKLKSKKGAHPSSGT